jgi:hypothetical protein
MQIVAAVILPSVEGADERYASGIGSMFPEDPSLFSMVKTVPVMTVGKIRKRIASGNYNFTVIAIRQASFNDIPEGVKPRVDIVKSLFQCLKLFRRYEKLKKNGCYSGRFISINSEMSKGF